jgi:hypothetical protein
VLPSAIAILSGSWSFAAAKGAWPCAIVAARGRQAQSGLAAWSFPFACRSFGSSLNRVRNRLGGPSPSIHRFTIYFGLGGAVRRHGSGGARVREPGTSGSRARATWIAQPGSPPARPALLASSRPRLPPSAEPLRAAGIPGFPRRWRQTMGYW